MGHTCITSLIHVGTCNRQTAYQNIFLKTCFVRAPTAGVFTYVSALWFTPSIKQLGNEEICMVIVWRITFFKGNKFNILSCIFLFLAIFNSSPASMLYGVAVTSLSWGREETTTFNNCASHPFPFTTPYCKRLLRVSEVLWRGLGIGSNQQLCPLPHKHAVISLRSPPALPCLAMSQSTEVWIP